MAKLTGLWQRKDKLFNRMSELSARIHRLGQELHRAKYKPGNEKTVNALQIELDNAKKTQAQLKERFNRIMRKLAPKMGRSSGIALAKKAKALRRFLGRR